MKQEKLNKMLTICAVKFDGEYDKGGTPYFMHCLEVMRLLGNTNDEDLKCIALGHDLLEDTDVTYEQLGHWFNSRIAIGILYLTKNPMRTYDQYIENLKGNRDAVLVKIADLRHNSDITRLKGVTQKDIDRSIKYQNTYLKLSQVLKEMD